jgi:fumarylacetoacetase
VALTSWIPVADSSPFPLQNLPYGVFSAGHHRRHVGVPIGDQIVDLTRLVHDERHDLAEALSGPTLNPFMALGRPTWTRLRRWLTERLGDEAHRPAVEPYLMPLAEAELHLPFAVADYVDFYSSEHHATNVGRIFRPDGAALTPNWKHLPIGYHGRSSTVVVSGTPIVRPSGQHKAPADATPTFGPSQRLDIEAEVGFVVGTPSQLGEPVGVADFAEHVFGVCLVNDWSARDIQAWEYVPLGPFLGKSFATSVSPWIVPLEALEAARCDPPPRDPAPLPYLRDADPWGLRLELEVELNGTVVSRPPFDTMYWTPAQQLAHLTVNGASVRTGDLYASGTVSGPRPEQRGSLLELSWSGAEPVTLDDGSTRSFLEDGDTAVIRAWTPGDGGVRIGFGEVAGTIAPAHPVREG